MLNARPDFQVSILRGNVDTRLRKLDAGEYDAILLAAAGLRRLGLEQRITEFLSYDVCLPAISQGALGLEGRADDRFELQVGVDQDVGDVLLDGVEVDTQTDREIRLGVEVQT